jgi:hypothetical protein
VHCCKVKKDERRVIQPTHVLPSWNKILDPHVMLKFGRLDYDINGAAVTSKGGVGGR